MSTSSWLRGRKVGVTGASGALGRAVVPQLIDAGAKVVRVLSRTASVHSTDLLRIERIVGDVRDPSACARLASRCDLVVHLAAEANAARGRSAPTETIHVNVAGTGFLLDACRDQEVQQVVFASTGYVYGSSVGSTPVPESAVPAPLNVYAASKLAAEALVTGYAGEFGFSGVVLRFANLYGAQSPPTTVVGRALTQGLTGGPIDLATLRPVRDFVTFGDAAEAVAKVGEALFTQEGGHVFNVGTGLGNSIEELRDLVVQAAGIPEPPNPPRSPQAPAVDESMPVLVLDPSRLRALTGWSPSTPFREGIRMALEELMTDYQKVVTR